MKYASWIVCERRGHWAAALRTECARHESFASTMPRLYETRSIAELNERLNDHPLSFALLEVTRRNIAEVLDLLPAADRSFTHIRFAALIDRQSFPAQPAADTSTNAWALVRDALWEAGASEVITSLVQVRQLVNLGRRHFENLAQVAAEDPKSLSLADWAWASLPWQDH